MAQIARNLGGVSRKRTDAALAMPPDIVDAYALTLLWSNFVRPRLQAIWATQLEKAVFGSDSYSKAPRV